MAATKTALKEFEIASGVKNTSWKTLNLTTASSKDNWEKAISMFDKRMMRFTEPIRILMETPDTEAAIYAGFSIIAIDCLLIETLQSFRTGRTNPLKGDKKSKETIVNFLTQRSNFKKHFDLTTAETFYNHFRCGILHQGEIKSSGLIRIDTADMVSLSEDKQSLIINRWCFHKAILEEIKEYKEELLNGNDVALREHFIKKMNDISRL